MKKVLTLLAFAALPLALPAQYESILKNPDVVWAAEMEVRYTFNAWLRADSLPANDFMLRKNFDPNDATPREGDEQLFQKILDEFYAGRWPVWRMDTTTRQIYPANSDDGTGGRDTLITFDPVTNEERIVVARYLEVSGTYFSALRAKQLLFYDSKRGEFGLYTLAIAPVALLPKWHFSQNRQDTALVDFYPIWLKTPPFSAKNGCKHTNLNKKKIIWAAQIRTWQNSPKFSELHVLKSTSKPIQELLFDRFATDRKYRAEDALGSPIEFSARKQILFERDTVLDWDEKSLTDEYKVVGHEIRAEDLTGLRLVENWFWDAQKGQLSIELERFGPLVAGTARERWQKFEAPLFFKTIRK